jgi:hypothetical protein
VDFVALLEKKIGQIGSVLARDSDDECFFHKFIRNRAEGDRLLV